MFKVFAWMAQTVYETCLPGLHI